MHLFVFAFGKCRTDGIRQTADYYQRNLKRWIPTEEVELKAVPIRDKTPAGREQTQLREAELLWKAFDRRLSPRSRIFLLDETGPAYPTREWAGKARKWEASGLVEVAFCIGGSLGFHETIRRKADERISFGPQTVSHEIARVILYEQLFRTWSLLRGHPYHNEGA